MAGAAGWSAAPDGDGDVAGVMMITEWDGIGEEFKANRWAIAMQRALSHVSRFVLFTLPVDDQDKSACHTPLRFSDGFLLSQRPPPPLPRRASDPMGALAPPDRAPAAATDLPKKPRSSNLNIIPSSSKFSKGIPDPRVKTPVKTPSREARLAAAATPHAAARERERLRARERAQVTSAACENFRSKTSNR
jgi:hypothetical protein